MSILRRLCQAARTISPNAYVKFTAKTGTNGEELWSGTIGVGDAIITEHTGSLEEVIDQLSYKLTRLSTAVIDRLSRVTPVPGALKNNGQDQQDPGREGEP